MSLKHRPRFAYRIDLPPDAARARVEQCLQTTPHPLVGRHFRAQCELSIAPHARHVWSPHMSVSFEPSADGTWAHGHVGPGLPIWSLFITLYGAFGMFATAGLILAASQLTLRHTPWGLALTAAALTLAAVLYTIGKFGERLAEPQTHLLHAFLQDCVGATPTTPLSPLPTCSHRGEGERAVSGESA